MTTLIEGKNRIRDLVDADISSAEHGTGTTAIASTDTSLATSVGATNDVTTNVTANQTLEIRHVLLSAVGTGNTYYEFGVFMNSDTDMLLRVLYPAYAHTSDKELHTITTLRFL